MVKQHKTKNLRDGITVLSLCDGMSCGRIALEKAGFKVNRYYASEIKDIAIKVTMDNYPDTIQIGDVHKVNYKNGVLHTENGDFETDIDLVCFGSPCQSFSISIVNKPDIRIGLKDKNRSGLFYECYRVLKEVNPEYFLMENVASIRNSDRDLISQYLDVEPLLINASDVAPALRKRYYWTNIPVRLNELESKIIHFQDILTDGYTDRERARCLTVIDSRPNSTPCKMVHRYFSTGFTTLIFKDKQHYEDCVKEYNRLKQGKKKVKAEELDNYKGHVFDGVRYMNQTELERCQTVPQGYTKCLTRNKAADVLGDGWTVDVIAFIFSFMG